MGRNPLLKRECLPSQRRGRHAEKASFLDTLSPSFLLPQALKRDHGVQTSTGYDSSLLVISPPWTLPRHQTGDALSMSIMPFFASIMTIFLIKF